MVLIHPSLRSDTTILASDRVDNVAINIRGTRMACIYLPPSLSQDARLDVLWQSSEYDVIVGDLNIRMPGSSRSIVTLREALLHFAAESNLELHEAGSELDHLLARSCASQSNYNQTALRTDHRQQSFTVAHHPPRLPMKSPAYSYPIAFYILTPLLNADTQPAFTQMLCGAYDTYADFISLSIQEQRGLLYIEAITRQDVVDSLDELLVRIVHASQDRADDRANKCTKPPTAPQSICSAVRLFRSLKNVSHKKNFKKRSEVLVIAYGWVRKLNRYT